MQISELRQGQRVRVTLKNGDTFDVDVQRATHAGRDSFCDVTFADGHDGLLWTKLEGVCLVRIGWVRSQMVESIVRVYASEYELALAVCNGEF